MSTLIVSNTELQYCTQMTQIQTQIYADQKEYTSESPEPAGRGG
jgi:hypothetical protein